MMTAVVVDTPKDQKRRQAPGEMAIFEPEEEQAKGKDYRRPTPEEVQKAEAAAQELTRVFREIPFGLPTEPLAGKEALAPKWDHDKKDGELIDDASRFGGNREKSKAAYEEGMYRAFLSCHQALAPEGRLVTANTRWSKRPMNRGN